MLRISLFSVVTLSAAAALAAEPGVAPAPYDPDAVIAEAAPAPPQVPAYWQPGGYGAAVGSPQYYKLAPPPGYKPLPSAEGVPVDPRIPVYYPPQGTTDPYEYHFGPGHYRHHEHGHYRFPYYSYRAPWYFPGHPVYVRSTNYAW